ncbi:hypothetical protein SLW70_08925 [Flavobacterium sp. NG2]|uniref:hypothetical protein n=1 Tax=Flavobacterium sp. NG2 TaxID=3097547 RepID=UPI002A7FBFEC|nr:hypothetical protein [Flavobacterium sp. NG2]WPR70072.1 hypothetical protein SLW70_08925 [Flavobacterium sp. NG2]
MKKPTLKNIYFVFLMLVLSSSCTSNLNFDQVNDLKLTPIAVANLTYFEAPAHEFVTNGVETNAAFGAQNFDAFRDSFFKDNLIQADFFFEITNTINRAYTIDLVLVDEFDQILYSINFVVPASTGTPRVVTKTEIFKDAKLALLKQTKKMGFRVIMAPGPALTENSPGSLKLRSSATVYMEIQ